MWKSVHPSRSVGSPARLVGRQSVRVVVGPLAVRPQVVFGEVEERPADHDCGQVEEVADGLGLHVGQRPVQPQHGRLCHVVRLFPPPKVGVPAEQLAGQLHEPVAGVVDVQRQEAVVVVVAVEEVLLLVAVDRVVGGVDVEGEFGGRRLE